MEAIKFRAWDKEKKKMWTPIRSIDFAHGYVELSKLAEPESDKDFDEVVLMQSTGLLDKNGKEIYEGDIVSTGEVNPYKIIFKEGCFGFENINQFNRLSMNFAYMTNDLASIVKVIGNIYENPELL